jgi:site-specific recombinase XerD
MQYSKRRQKSNESASTPEQGEEKKQSLTLSKALEVFLASQTAAGHSVATQNDYKCVIHLFLHYIADEFNRSVDEILIDEIAEVDVFQWLSHLRASLNKRGKPFSSRSIETYSRDVTVFFNWLVQHGYLESSPMAQVKKFKADKALIRVFSEDELLRLDKACDRAPKGQALTTDERKALASRDRAFLWLLLSTGVRISEACGLLFSDVDWDKGMIYVRGKGAKERKVPFGKVARQHLDTYIRYWRGGSTQHDEYVFLNAWGTPLSSASAGNIFSRLKKVSGIDDKRVSAHTCRHWFAVNCIKNGMPTIVLKEILGHEDWDMIEVYVRLAEQDSRELYTRFSPVDALQMHRNAKEKRQQMRDWRNSRKRR